MTKSDEDRNDEFRVTAENIFALADKDPATYALAAAVLIAATMIVDAISEASDTLNDALYLNDESVVGALLKVKDAIINRE